MTYVTACVRFPLVVVSFVPCLFADVSPRQLPTDADNEQDGSAPAKPCPKLFAPFLSVAFFWWFTP